MSIIYFRNPGTLPLVAITTLGISVKESDNPFGRFGTGLKYTIAGILRLGEEISIQTDGKTYYFFSKPEDVRGKTFHVVWMTTLANGQSKDERLGFTTELGRHWEPWMYIRELWSNMKDEGGTHGYVVAGDNFTPEGQTRIMISGKVMETAYAEMGLFILKDDIFPVFDDGRVQLVHKPNPAEATIFFKGVRVGKLDHNYPYAVNLLLANVPITEDRVLSSVYWATGCLHDAVLGGDNESLIKGWLTSKEGTASFHYGTAHYHFSETAKAVLQKFWNESPNLLNASSSYAAEQLFKPDDSAIEFELSPGEKEKFSRAYAFIRQLGCTQDIEWVFVDPKDETTFGFVRDGKAYICKNAFANGTQFLAQTMMEEYLHVVKQFRDESRALQNFLFAKVISLAEEQFGVL